MCNCDKRTNCGSDEKVAIHEAGHALMFDALGIPLSFVTIDEGCQGEEPSFEGCFKLGSDTNNVCDVIAGTMAGPAASFFIANEPADREATLKFRSDQTILRKIHQAETEAESYDEFWARLQVFLGVWLRDWMWNHRDAIQRFAADLSLERTLSGQELARSLTAAWAGLKPDAIALHGEVASTLNQLLNTNPSSPSSNTEIIGIERSMVAYRLVNQEHDPIEVGSVLSRTSDHSHQKNCGRHLFRNHTRRRTRVLKDGSWPCVYLPFDLPHQRSIQRRSSRPYR
jgi:hypothetical protein